MSSYAANVARWNAIPMARESPGGTTGTKRSRSRSRSASPVLKLQGEYDSSDEDDVSIVSRSPSPSADKMDITVYDEYHPSPEQEVITVETKIKSTNKGYAMLAKLGWTAGQPLGLSEDARVDPIPFSVKNDVTGLGKRAQDERMIETTVSQRRGLDSERQIKETAEQRQTREQKVAEKEVLKSQIASTLKPFYCALCDKQYQTVAQYDEHTNSYAHHHKQRFKDMQTNAKGLGGGKQDKEARLAKERKREEKELKRMAKAQGVKVVGGVVSANALAPVAPPPPVDDGKGFKKSGWATVSTPIEPAQVTNGRRGGAQTSGWATVSGNAASSSTEAPASRRTSSSNPGFRTAGFETLETTTAAPPAAASGGWASVSSASNAGTEPSRSGWSKPPAAPPPPATPPPPPPPSAAPPPPPPPSAAPPPPPPPSTRAPPPPPSSHLPPPPPPNFPPRPPSPPRHARPPSPPRGPPTEPPYRNGEPRYNRPPSPPRRDDRDWRDWHERARYQGGYRR